MGTPELPLQSRMIIPVITKCTLHPASTIFSFLIHFITHMYVWYSIIASIVVIVCWLLTHFKTLYRAFDYDRHIELKISFILICIKFSKTFLSLQPLCFHSCFLSTNILAYKIYRLQNSTCLYMTTQRKRMQLSLPFLHCLQAWLTLQPWCNFQTWTLCIAEIMPPEQWRVQ